MGFYIDFVEVERELYGQTDCGFDIIRKYYPHAEKNKAFKTRDEKIASTHTMQSTTQPYTWMITDFGVSDHALFPVQLCMEKENLTRPEALKKLCSEFGVTIAGQNPDGYKPKVEMENVPNGDEDLFDYEEKEFTEKELRFFGHDVTIEVLEKYGYHSLKWYTHRTSKGDKKRKIYSDERFFIFMHNCGDFKKIYMPFADDFPNSHLQRFDYRPKGKAAVKDYMNGLAELKAAAAELNKSGAEKAEIDEHLGSVEASPKPGKKIPMAILCSGERDAMNVAALGYYPLWMNSESAKLSGKIYAEIMQHVDKLYNIPDIDETGIRCGRELALKFLEIYTVELPGRLLQHRDWRGKRCKDFRDFLDYAKEPANDFKKLLNVAMPCRFWDMKKSKQDKINTAYLLHFLKYSGYRKVRMETEPGSTEFLYIKVSNNVAEWISEVEVANYLLGWATDRGLDNEIRNAILDCKKIQPELLDKLDEIEIPYKISDPKSQTFVFENCAVKATADNIEVVGKDTAGIYWKERVCHHRFERIEPAFETSFDDETKAFDIEIKHTKSHGFRMNINSCRAYWRKEFEGGDQNPADGGFIDADYKNNHKWDIAGPRLSKSEQEEQKNMLLNRLYTIGYLLHSYKSPSDGWMAWLMEIKLTEEDESNGGSGKSFILDYLLKPLIDKKQVDGSSNIGNPKNETFGSTVTPLTTTFVVADAYKGYPIRDLYEKTNGKWIYRKLYHNPCEIPYEQSPKIAITSNFPPIDNKGSSLRRLLYCSFSDYYHAGTKEYDEERKISDDFGYNICVENDKNYTETYWNEDLNFLMDCVSFYLKARKIGVQVQPPKQRINDRIALQSAGESFVMWADEKFSQGSENLDQYLVREELVEDYKKNISGKVGTRDFMKKLRLYCDSKDYIERLNPPGCKGYSEKRKSSLQINVGGKTTDFIYIKSRGVDIKDYEQHQST